MKSYKYILLVCSLLFLTLSLLFTYIFTETMKYDFVDSTTFVVRFDNEVDIAKVQNVVQQFHKSSEIKQFGPKNQIIVKMIYPTDNDEKLRQTFYDHFRPFFQTK